eukprot:Nitzschia sp. Nitz4//scaffold32_size149145//9025//10039//NITZ4_002862-RA/size149145-augustus-gene-0.47-mRNA-1//-1//CDS//3329548018//9156//frame0
MVSSTAASDSASDEVTLLRKALASLSVKRKAIEQEADAIFLELTTPPSEGVEPMGIDTPLVDSDGYPRGDIDVYRARTLRQRFQVLKTDHKQRTQKMEEMLVQLAALKNPGKKQEERNEQDARSAKKPKPKYDPVSGKWVVMNWNGTVAGVPGGEKRQFEQVDRQISALTGDSEDLLLSQGSIVSDSTRSATTADRDPQPPPNTVPHMTPFCRVDAVASDSPAHRAGLKEEDRIVQFGDLHEANHNHLKGIAELVPQAAAEQAAIPIVLLRRPQVGSDTWEKHTMQLLPQPWSGRGLLGCHIVPC